MLVLPDFAFVLMSAYTSQRSYAAVVAGVKAPVSASLPTPGEAPTDPPSVETPEQPAKPSVKAKAVRTSKRRGAAATVADSATPSAAKRASTKS